MKDRAIFLALRRVRAPLLALIAAYGISILGLVLIPGIEVEGEARHLGFFHAFYVISYTATTIGFGEIPYAFSDAQRLWVIISAYLCVFSWLYAIGALIALFQDPAFNQIVSDSRFTRGVRRLERRFFIVCGYGDTGKLVVRAMIQQGCSAVVLDANPDRINELSLENLSEYVPSLCADASQPGTLEMAGLMHPCCAGVVALTNRDEINIKISIACKMLAPGLKVICRASSHDAEANLESFGTDAVINPFDTFADRLALALHSPNMYLIHEWLTEIPGSPLSPRIDPPRGLWILCGYGRFGKAVDQHLKNEGINTVIVEQEPELTHAPENVVVGRGTEADTLREARVEEAVGVVAGTDNDANNLSIIVSARQLNRNLFLVARQHDSKNEAIFRAAELDLIMQRSRAIAHRILALIRSPLFVDFLRLTRQQNRDWAKRLLDRLWPLAGNRTPELWVVDVSPAGAPALVEALGEGRDVKIAHLVKDPRDRDKGLACIPLLLSRDGDERLLPEERTALCIGDQLLVCGRRDAEARMSRTLSQRNTLLYVNCGRVEPEGSLWRWMSGYAQPKPAQRPSGTR